MNRAVRTFLVWVMVFAMPVQGMAASTMLLCGPSHARMMQGLGLHVPVAKSGDGGHARHASAATEHSGHDHVGGAAPVASAAPADADGNSAGSLAQNHGKFSCSACAACCAALALPARFEMPQAVGTTRGVRSSPAAPVTSHQPDGLDRPPRAVVA